MCIHNFLESCVSTTTGLDGARGAPLHIERRIGIRIHVDVRLGGLQCLIEQRVVESCVTDQTRVDFLPALENNPTKCKTLDMTSSNGLPSNSIAAFFVKRNMAVQSNEQRQTLDRYQSTFSVPTSTRGLRSQAEEMCFVCRDALRLASSSAYKMRIALQSSATPQKKTSPVHHNNVFNMEGSANSPVDRCRIMTANNTS